jgi:calcyclin binding protein
MEPTPADLIELKRIVAVGTTPYVESVIRAEIAKLSPQFPEAPVPVATQPKPAQARPRYEAIESYAFVDSNDAAKVVVRGVKGLADAKIEFTPAERSFSITIQREGLSNLKLTVSPLKKILPASSNYSVRGETLTITLDKKKKTTWTKLKKTSSGIKKTPPGEKKKDDDPNSALMDMMKKMYDEGDDEMKRTMSKAWWEAQHKKDGDKDPKF